jgi:WXG100 family type VII secretion target
MAADTLLVTPETLKTTATSFETTGTNVNNLTQQMTSIVTGLSGQIWSGEAATMYVTKFNGLQDDMDLICQTINKKSEDLIAMAEKFINTENTNIELANSLSTDGFA